MIDGDDSDQVNNRKKIVVEKSHEISKKIIIMIAKQLALLFLNHAFNI